MADTKRVITCPACDKEMKKIFIKDLNINVDICMEGCGGVLFDNRELEKFDEECENADEIFEALKDKFFKHVNEKEVRICTVCDTPMVKQGAGVEGVEIDVCNVCGAKFLDYGELEKIRKLFNDESFKEKIRNIVDEYAKDNTYVPGGPLAAKWTKIYPNLGFRDASEKFVGKFLEFLDEITH